MFIRKLSLPRRTFLKGLGTALALPLLDAMVPAATALAKTAASPVPRLGFVYFPNGIIVDRWFPTAGGAAFEFSPSLRPLEPHRGSLVVVSNLSRAGTAIGDHAVSSAGWLTGALAKRTEGEDVRAGTTIDQIVARQIGRDVPFPSLEVATEDFTGYVGGCTPGFSCAYMNTISWATPTSPLPMEIDPRAVFERMFGRAGTPEQRAAWTRRSGSILDSVGADASRLKQGLGSRDRERLDSYLDDVREIERRIQQTEARAGREVVHVDAPAGIPESFEEHVRLMFDLLAVAYQTDMTRVFTFMMSREASQRTYPELDINEPHHGISHHFNDAAKIEKCATINAYHVGLFEKFVAKLGATPDGDGSLLDHSLIFYGAGMGSGNAHAPDPLPLVAVGGGTRGGRHIQPKAKTSIADLWLGTAHRFGADIPSFGDSTSPLDLG
jgi:Protein of unknown function (DUF1552)